MATDHDSSRPTAASRRTPLPIVADAALLAEGWVRRHVADPQRAEESVALYQAIGLEVRVQELTPSDFGPGCEACAETACAACVVIYTRTPEVRANGGQ